MSREIEYRQWNPLVKRFHYWGFLGKGHFAGPETGATTMEDALKYSQQNTGLLDKNGKKIFEGDIVKISVDYVDESEFSIQEVRWGKEGGYFCDEEFGFDFIPLLGNDDLELEIIGNIYESSHLLKDRNV